MSLRHGADFFEEPLEVNTLAVAVLSQRIPDGDVVMNEVIRRQTERLARRAFRKEHC